MPLQLGRCSNGALQDFPWFLYMVPIIPTCVLLFIFLDCYLYPYKHIVYIVLHMLLIYFLDSFFLFIENLTL